MATEHALSTLSLEATIFLLLKHTSAIVATFIFVYKQFLNQPCTARTLPNSGENVLHARESFSPKITSAPPAANASTAVKELTPLTSDRNRPTKSRDIDLPVWKSFNEEDRSPSSG
jgi:hypothetical protein